MWYSVPYKWRKPHIKNMSVHPSIHEPLPEAKLLLRFQCTSVQELQKCVSKHKFCKTSLCNSHTSISAPHSPHFFTDFGTVWQWRCPRNAISDLEFHENWCSGRHTSFNGINTTLPALSSLSVWFWQNLIQNMSTETKQATMSFVRTGTVKPLIQFGPSVNIYPYFPHWLADLSKILINRTASKAVRACVSFVNYEHRGPYSSSRHQYRHINFCAMNPYVILKAQNVLIKTVYYITQWTIHHLVY